MRGNPLLRLLTIAVFLGLAWIPLSCVLHREPTRKQAVTPEVGSAKSLQFRFKATGKPRRISIRLEDRNLVDLSEAGQRDARASVEIPADGADLVVRAEWADEEPHALNVEVFHEGKLLAGRTYWGAARLEDVLYLPGDSK